MIGQRTDRVLIEQERAREGWHMTSSSRKILAHIIDIFLHSALGRALLQFDRLLC
jgi:hypothetical protein